MCAKCFSERENHSLTNNVFQTLKCDLCSRLICFTSILWYMAFITLSMLKGLHCKGHIYQLFLCVQDAFQSNNVFMTFKCESCSRRTCFISKWWYTIHVTLSVLTRLHLNGHMYQLFSFLCVQNAFQGEKNTF